MKNIFILFACTLCIWSQPVLSKCTFFLQADDGEPYTLDEYSRFIESEIRQRLSRTRQLFDVYLIGKCDGDITGTVTLNMESRFLYLEGINGRSFDDDVERYTDDKQKISVESFENAFVSALDFQSLTKAEQQSIVKIFAFIIAEAARFSVIEDSVNNILLSSREYEWVNYCRLVRRWRVLSVFANTHGLARGEQYVGGSNAFLIAPITQSIVNGFNTAVKRGVEIDRGYEISNSQRKKERYPLRFVNSNCRK